MSVTMRASLARILLCAQPIQQLPALPPLPASLEAISSELLPQHLAVIMDGNARWASRQGLPKVKGHEAGVSSLRKLITSCASLPPLETLTVYAFSAENFGRPAAEVRALFELIESTLEAEADELHLNGVCLAFVGDRRRLPSKLLALIERLETREPPIETRLLLCVALAYGGRQSVAAAAQSLAMRVRAGELAPASIDADALADEIRRIGGGPPSDPDLVIRTGGQYRMSNFLTMESAYAELCVQDCLWPDFGHDELASALRDFSRRRRTHGIR